MKPKLVIYDTNRELTTGVVLKFAQGASADKNWEVRFQKINKFRKNGLDSSLRPGIDAVASLGVLRGTGEMFRAAAQAGIDYYYMDHAYFNPGYDGLGWMRIVKNGHSRNDFVPSSKKRYEKFFQQNNPVFPWKTRSQRGDKIIICPPTHAVAWYMRLTESWTEQTVNRLKTLLPESQHHRIVVRAKPNEPIVDEHGNLLRFQHNVSEGSLNDDLKNATCVIAYNSMVALTATLQGIPVITSDHSCCKSISYSVEDFAQGADPSVFDVEPATRHGLMYWLANNQWNIEEIRNGTAWRMLQENN